jgi:hypothetical protein
VYIRGAINECPAVRRNGQINWFENRHPDIEQPRMAQDRFYDFKNIFAEKFGKISMFLIQNT